jgi:hypothetical protein
MSYTLGFYTVSLDELTARLAAQDLPSDPLIVAKQAVDLLRELGSPVDVVDHGSAGGTWFRDRFVDEVLGGLIGAEMAGVRWSGFPSMGWLTRSELADVVKALDEAGADALAELDEPESEELFELVNDILRMAAEAGRDLVTLYS